MGSYWLALLPVAIYHGSSLILLESVAEVAIGNNDSVYSKTSVGGEGGTGAPSAVTVVQLSGGQTLHVQGVIQAPQASVIQSPHIQNLQVRHCLSLPPDVKPIHSVPGPAEALLLRVKTSDENLDWI